MTNTKKPTKIEPVEDEKPRPRKRKLRVPEPDIRQVRLSFRVHNDLEEALKAAAQAEGRTVSSLLTQISIEYIIWATGEDFDRLGRRVPDGAPKGRRGIGSPIGLWTGDRLGGPGRRGGAK